jgi:hypothetical protein
MSGGPQPSRPTRPNDPWTRLALLGGLLLFGEILVHLPASLWAGNALEFERDYWTFFWPGIAGVAAGLALVLGLCRLLPRAARAVLATLLCAAGIIGWFYASFLAGHMSVLNGQGAPMDFNTALGAWELAVVAAAALAIAFALGRNTQLAILVMLLFNIGLGAGTLVTVLRAHTSPLRDRDVASVLRFGAGANVLVVLLDTLQSDVTDRVFQQDPALKAAFDGFRFFKDTAGSAPTTYVSMPAIHAGHEYRGEADLSAYAAEAITHKSFLNRFAAAGYETTLINPILNLCPVNATNCIWEIRPPNAARALSEGLRLLDLSLFRVAPVWVKQRIYAGGLWLAQRWIAGVPHEIAALMGALETVRELTQGLTVSSDVPTLKMLHLGSTHPPFVLNDDCRTFGESSPERAIPQSRCALQGLADLFATMKAKGIYDNAVILVLADHGAGLPTRYGDDVARSGRGWTRLAGSANPTFLLKPKGSRGPLQDDAAPVYLADVGATLCAATGACAAPAGIPAGQAGADRPRRYNHYAWITEFWDASQGSPAITAYELRGPVWNPAAWQAVPADYQIGETIDFSTPASAPYVAFGWGQAEDLGRWTSDDVAHLTLHLTEPVGEPLELVAHGMGFVPPPLDHQDVTWTVNGRELATWRFTQIFAPTEQRLLIPADVIGPSRDLRFELRIPGAIAPVTVGMGADIRLLGMGLKDLRLQRTSAPARVK